MRQFQFPRRKPLDRSGVSSMPSGQRALPAGAVLAPEACEHGAYYAGWLGSTSAIVRWHAVKRRFVFGEYNLGGPRIKAVAHISDRGEAEGFAPLSKTEPKDAHRISDYAFETVC